MLGGCLHSERVYVLPRWGKGYGLVWALSYRCTRVVAAASPPALCPLNNSVSCAVAQELAEHFGVVFNSLLCLNNMPIKRWADHLAKE